MLEYARIFAYRTDMNLIGRDGRTDGRDGRTDAQTTLLVPTSLRRSFPTIPCNSRPWTVCISPPALMAAATRSTKCEQEANTCMHRRFIPGVSLVMTSSSQVVHTFTNSISNMGTKILVII
jgi:hypothetical protein